MRRRPWRRIAALLACFAGFTVSASAAPDPQGTGVLTLNGSPVTLNHVLIVWRDNEERPPLPPETVIYLSDHEIPMAMMRDAIGSNVVEYVRRQKITLVAVSADPEGKEDKALFAVYYAPGMMEGETTSWGTAHAFTGLTIDGARASGTVDSTAPNARLTATFDAPVFKDTIKSDPRGAEAAASAPAKAMLACAAALRAGNRTAIAAGSTPRRVDSLEWIRGQVSKKEFADFVDEYLAPATMRTGLSRVIIRDATASAIYGEGAVATLVRDGDAWKCD